MGLIHILAAMIGAGVFERYPRLRVSFGESGIGWIPYALDRMDFEFEDRFRDLMKLKPSEYWQRQCKATFQFDPIGPKLLNVNNLMTVDTLMWGSDYPHTDGIWPESTKYIDEQFKGLAAEDIRKITCDNAAKFYNLTN
jgi:predicted TIM-barrel fold metal-dependent hydrolase